MALISLMTTFSRCQSTPARAQMLTLAGVSIGNHGGATAGPETHRSGAYPTGCWQLVGLVGINPGLQGALVQMFLCRTNPLNARLSGRGGLQNAMISADGVIKRAISPRRKQEDAHAFFHLGSG